jgi:hypothetical protein
LVSAFFFLGKCEPRILNDGLLQARTVKNLTFRGVI